MVIPKLRSQEETGAAGVRTVSGVRVRLRDPCDPRQRTLEPHACLALICSKKAHRTLGTPGILTLLPFHDGGQRGAFPRWNDKTASEDMILWKMSQESRKSICWLKVYNSNLEQLTSCSLPSQALPGGWRLTWLRNRKTSPRHDQKPKHPQAPQLSPWIHFRESTTQVSTPRLLSGREAGFPFTLASHSHQIHNQVPRQRAA